MNVIKLKNLTELRLATIQEGILTKPADPFVAPLIESLILRRSTLINVLDRQSVPW